MNVAKVCELCSTTSDIEVRKGITHEDFNSLLLVPNVALSDKPIICQNCAKHVRIASSFKIACRYTEHCLISFRMRTFAARFNLNRLYLSKNFDMTEIPDGYNVCRLCIQLMPSDSSIALNSTERTETNAQFILTKYFPELNLSLTKDPMICLACHESVHDYYGFVKNCLYWQEKKNAPEEKPCEMETVSNGIPKLEDEKVNSDIANALKSEDSGEEYFSFEIKEEHSEGQEENEVSIKNEGIECTKEEYNPRDMEAMDELFEGQEKADMNIKNEEIIIKSDEMDTDSFTNSTPQCTLSSAEPIMYTCEKCQLQTACKYSLEIHMQIHSIISEVTIYIRNLDDNKTECENVMVYMWNHTLSHGSGIKELIYKCGLCTYQTNEEHIIRDHMLEHKNMSMKKLSVHKCDTCGYQAKKKWDVYKHMLTHKRAEDVSNINQPDVHVLAKRSTATTKVLKCDTCHFQTRYRRSMSRHKLKHKYISEVVMYKCEICVYQTKCKTNLKKHMEIHCIGAANVCV